MLKKQVIFEGEKKRFYVGNGEYIVLKSGAVLDSNHKVAKLFPSYCVDILVEEPKKEVEESPQLLVEEPVDSATTELEEVEESNEENIEIKIESFRTKQELDDFAATLGIELDRRKSLKNMKKELLSKI